MSKTAFISIVGRPNVGKSTLLNSILKEKVSIVSKRPQTTRNRITGIYTKEEVQFVFLDTPGVHKPRTKLGDYMVKTSIDSLGGVDACILVVEPREAVGDIEQEILNAIKKAKVPCILCVNKIDAMDAKHLANTIAAYSSVFDFAAVVPTIAKSGKGVDTLLQECEQFLVESPWFFPEDMVTDQTERQLASEIIREKLLRTLSDEIPHGTAVSIEEFKEEPKMVRIRAEIYCERASHKGIIIGKNGQTLKTIGTSARLELEKMFGIKVFLDLYVRVKEHWRDSQLNLNDLGYRDDHNS